jgi:protein TonB
MLCSVIFLGCGGSTQPPAEPAVAPAPAPAPAPKKIVPAETVQPEVKPEEPVAEDEGAYDDEYGDPEGVEGGVEGGVVGGIVGTPAPPPPPGPPPPAPTIIPQVAMHSNMISGEKAIVPDDATKKQIFLDGKSRLVFTLKLCVSPQGVPTTITFMKTSGYPAYDQKVLANMRHWRFKPFVVDGKPVHVCTAYTFIYNQTN